MKLKVLVAAAALSLSTGAFAQQWFAANVRFVGVLPTTRIEAQVVNTTYQMMFCSGNVYGITNRGVQQLAFFNDYVPPMQYRQAYITAPSFDPIVSFNSNVVCRF